MPAPRLITPEEAQQGVIRFLQFCEWSSRRPGGGLYDLWKRTNDGDLTGHANASQTLVRIYGSFEKAVEAAKPIYEQKKAEGEEYIGQRLGLDRTRITKLLPRPREAWQELFGDEP